MIVSCVIFQAPVKAYKHFFNSLTFDEHNQVVELDTPYPGDNLFSLASVGGIYIRDPRGTVTSDQLNGGEFTPLTGQDWQLIESYLEENDRLFDIPVDDLRSVNGQKLPPDQVYRKIQPRALRALMAEEAWVTEGDD